MPFEAGDEYPFALLELETAQVLRVEVRSP
jgi:hypothetical protein